ncbi:hypothetical protein B0H17DRAFT_1135851 [Mycena rosella]|uniref:Uncharacterized protein n=1 Tax=Mycena rosella TaxID=1033263 RepID=A0AAD7DCC5_MYCRO|nr:hypothetical protein B0H17DRAFT_1135851 [Mycena rosella]
MHLFFKFLHAFIATTPLLQHPLAGRSTNEALISCLTNHGLTVDVPQNVAWTNSATYDIYMLEPPPFAYGFRRFNTRFGYSPNAIIYPNKTPDVSKAVKCAVGFWVDISSLSGNMAQLKNIPRDATVEIGPGVCFGNVATELNTTYRRALAHSLFPYLCRSRRAYRFRWMGIGVAQLGSAALLIDQLVSAVLVRANGSVVDISVTVSGSILGYSRRRLFLRDCHSIYFPNTPGPRFRRSIRVILRPHSVLGQVCGAFALISNLGPYCAEGSRDRRPYIGGVRIGGYYMGSLADFKAIAASLLHVIGPADDTYLSIAERAWPEPQVPELLMRHGRRRLRLVQGELPIVAERDLRDARVVNGREVPDAARPAPPYRAPGPAGGACCAERRVFSLPARIALAVLELVVQREGDPRKAEET